MPEPRRRRLLLALLLLTGGAAGAVGYALSAGNERATPAAGGDQSGTGTVVGGSRPSPGPSAAPADDGGVFSISGRIEGLVPGRRATLPLTVTNPNPWPIEVRTLDTGVGVPAGAACPPGTLAVGRYVHTGGPAFAAPAGGSVVVPVPIELTDSPTQDQSGCADVTFALTFSGTAERVAP